MQEETKYNKYFTQETYDNIMKHEKNIWNSIGLYENVNMKILEVPVLVNDEQMTLHTIQCGSIGQPKLVMFHGWGGSALLFYKLIPYLISHFEIYMVDSIGMGISSRPAYPLEIDKNKNNNKKSSLPGNQEQRQQRAEFVLDQVLDCFEQWRKYMNINKFYLSGHSYGGYLALYYALKHPENIEQLFLISPVGLLSTPNISIEEFLAQLPFFKRQLFKFILNHYFYKRTTVQSVFNKGCWKLFSKSLLKKYIKKWKVSNEMKQDVIEYMNILCKLPESYHQIVFEIFGLPDLYGTISLEEIMNKKQWPFSTIFFHGQFDYMNSDSAKRLSGQFANINLHYIANSTHHINMENPRDLASHILQYFNQDQVNKVNRMIKIDEIDYRQYPSKQVPLFQQNQLIMQSSQ